MRSRGANAATARAFSLVIEPEFTPERAAIVLADSAGSPALEEAIAHLNVSLFDDEDRVAADAAEILVLALGRRRAAHAA